MQVNPIITKDLKIKMRGWKAPALITIYVLFLTAAVLLSFSLNRASSPFGTRGFNPAVAVGFYNILAVFQLIMLIFIVPAITGGVINGERERQTLDLLLCTNFSAFNIVIGKILVSIAHVLLLIAASLPIMGMVFLYGGVSIADLLLLFLFYVVTAFMLGSMGTFFSAVFKKSAVSIIVTYIIVIIMVIGTTIVSAIWLMTSLRYIPGGTRPSVLNPMWILLSNPLYGFSSVLEGMNRGISTLSRIFGMSVYSMYGSSSSVARSALGYPVLLGLTIKPWMINILFDLIISAGFIVLAALRIRPIKRRKFRG